MGRRSINTTKSGKYMNPTDQARKEARKKELKKNKKQRQMVRAAVLKGKDPQQLLVDLEKIDQMEYNVLQPSPLNEKVLKDKRKKLQSTLERVLKLYNKDDPDKWAELKRGHVEYERKRIALINYYESVKDAQDVQLEEIPLPINTLNTDIQASFPGMTSNIPLPPQMAHLRPLSGILKKSSAYPVRAIRKTAPGVPPGPPPDLEEFMKDLLAETAELSAHQLLAPLQKKSIRFAESEDMTENVPATNEPTERDVPPVSSDVSEAMETETEPVQSDKGDGGLKPTSLQQKLLAMSGQNIDEFLKEMDEVNRKRKADRAADLDARLAALGDRREGDEMEGGMEGGIPPPLMPPGVSHNMMPGIPGMMMRPPPRGVPSLMGIRLPPGPPPGLPPRMGMRMPPGPPPGLPPRMMRPPNMSMGPAPSQTNILTAAPQLINRSDQPSGPTIQAQAKIRSVSVDVTRFVPSSLRHKRDDNCRGKVKVPLHREPKVEIHQPVVRPGQTKDDAYQQFMREMEGLM